MDANSLPISETPGPTAPEAAPTPAKTSGRAVLLALTALPILPLYFLVQFLMRRALNPGEYGLFQTALAEATAALFPFIVVQLALLDTHIRLKAAQDQPALEKFLTVRSTLAVLATFLNIPFAIGLILAMEMGFPKPRTDIYILNVLLPLSYLLGYLSLYFLVIGKRFVLANSLVVLALLTQLGVSYQTTKSQPWSEAAELALIVGFVIVALPLLGEDEDDEEEVDPAKADQTPKPKLEPSNRETLMQRGAAAIEFAIKPQFLERLGGIACAVFAILTFTCSDAIACHTWLGLVSEDRWTPVQPERLDNFLAAGFIVRAIAVLGLILFGSALYLRRAPLKHTTSASVTPYWFYMLFAIAIPPLIIYARNYIAVFFTPAPDPQMAVYLYYFATAFVPVSFLNALLVFCVASKRYPECALAAASAILYFMLQIGFGRQPENMCSYLFGASLCALLLTAFLGVVRWSRTQP